MDAHKGKKVQKTNSLWARIVLGILILLMVGGFVYGIGWAIRYPITDNGTSKSAVPAAEVNEALIMLFAGGLGSGLYAIRAYLQHACDWKDFDPDFLPWYPFWMLMGALLSLIFYFTLRGGLLFLTFNGNQTGVESMNGWSLAAAGSLIGLFSKYALEKLRKVFLTVFGDAGEETPGKGTIEVKPVEVPVEGVPVTPAGNATEVIGVAVPK